MWQIRIIGMAAHNVSILVGFHRHMTEYSIGVAHFSSRMIRKRRHEEQP